MHPSTSAALPRASDSAALPRGGQSSVPARFHYQLPPGAYFGGEGALSAAAVPHTAAQFGGTGTLAAVLVALAAAGFAGEGTLKIPTDEADALFAGEGALAANAIPATAAIFTGEGMLGAATAGRTAAAFAGLGALGAAVTPAAAAAFSGAGALSATASIFSAMGMDKSGTQALPSNATTKVTGWSPRTGYPSTVINADDLLFSGSGTVNITLKVTLTGNAGAALTLRIRRNGSDIHTGTLAFNTATQTITINGVSIANNDRISVAITTPFGVSATVQTGSTNTFLTCDMP